MARDDSGTDEAPRGGLRAQSGILLWAVFLVALACILILGRFYSDQQRADIVARKGAELSAVRDLKIDQIVEWRAGLLNDGRTLAADPTLRDEFSHWLDDPLNAEAGADLRAWMAVLRKMRGYSSAIIVTADGSHWLATDGHPPPDPQVLARVRQAAASGETTLTDLYIDRVSGEPRLDVLAPLSDPDGSISAVAVLHRDPRMYLFPLLQKWPAPSQSSETLLVRPENGSLVYLNDIRFKKDAALRFRLPKTENPSLLAVQALSGPARTVDGVDYRGVQVFGSVGPVPGTNWYIVAKVDESEALAGLVESQVAILSAAIALLTIIGLTLLLVWRQRSSDYYRSRVEWEHAKAESDAQFRNIVDSSPSGMHLWQLEGEDRLVLTKANPAAGQLLGVDHSNLLGKTLEEAFPNLVGTEIPDLYRAVARGDIGSQSFEIPYEDERFGGYYAVTAFRTRPGIVAVDFIDISDRKHAEQALEERTEELQRSNAELEKFAYVASHDLQEPLRMVASYTQLLQRRYEGKLDDDADEFIGYAVDGATRMQQLINELLAYSRVGTQGAEFVDTDLDALLDRVLKNLELSITENAAVITRDSLPIVSCDPIQIGQVFQNLISNALKFRCEDTPRIHVGVGREHGEWVFCIRDNGVGIEPEYFDRIFVIFQRLQSRAEYPGTGMGLAICKRIIERHGGNIWVESEPGAGSTFFFALRDHKEP